MAIQASRAGTRKSALPASAEANEVPGEDMVETVRIAAEPIVEAGKAAVDDALQDWSEKLLRETLSLQVNASVAMLRHSEQWREVQHQAAQEARARHEDA